ncbi:unnamed protein product [Ixodes pacificus]
MSFPLYSGDVLSRVQVFRIKEVIDKDISARKTYSLFLFWSDVLSKLLSEYRLHSAHFSHAHTSIFMYHKTVSQLPDCQLHNR